ncbi:MAG: glycosyltransferase family 39 protein [Anaerolineales bacterium]|nr:glycosyltransferase family 39 protein [Anaerolineales bacterium]MCB8952284.1 glycosyltransferase family 39 protein [Ardenticatenales bacterium]
MREKFLPALSLHTSLILALRAQQLLPDSAHTDAAVWLFLAAILLFLGGIHFWPDAGSQSGEDWPTIAPPAQTVYTMAGHPWWQLVLVLASSALAAFAYRHFAFDTFTRSGVLAWVGSLALFLLTFAELPAAWLQERLARLRQGEWPIRLHWHRLALLLIFLVAVYFRVHRLAQVPSELGSDQAEKLLDVQDVLNGLRPIFFPRNTGREAFQFYLTALLIRYTPLEISHLALKVGTVMISLLAFPFTYLLSKELFDRRMGLLTVTLLSISHWHVAISRVGLRFPFTPAFAAPTLYFLVRAFRTNRRNDWLACGLFLGVGLHTYIPMRMVPLLLLLLVLLKAALDGRLARRRRPPTESTALRWAFWQNGVLAGATSFLVFLPLFRYMMDQPSMFWYRVTTRSSDALGQESVWQTLAVFWQNVKNAALMFNYRGDVVFANTIPFSPVLDWVTGGLFVLGLVYLLWRLVARRDRRPLYLLLMLFMLVLPSILSIAFPNENPSVVRTGGAIPIAMMIAALPLWATWNRFAGTFAGAGRFYVALLLLTIFVMAGRENYNWYFVRYDEQFRHSIWNASEMGQVVRGFVDSIGDFDHAYHIPYPYWVDTRAIAIDAGNINWNNVVMDVRSALEQQRLDPAPKLYLYYLPDSDARQWLHQIFPSGTDSHYASQVGPDKDFGVYFVPGE